MLRASMESARARNPRCVSSWVNTARRGMRHTGERRRRQRYHVVQIEIRHHLRGITPATAVIVSPFSRARVRSDIIGSRFPRAATESSAPGDRVDDDRGAIQHRVSNLAAQGAPGVWRVTALAGQYAPGRPATQLRIEDTQVGRLADSNRAPMAITDPGDVATSFRVELAATISTSGMSSSVIARAARSPDRACPAAPGRAGPPSTRADVVRDPWRSRRPCRRQPCFDHGDVDGGPQRWVDLEAASYPVRNWSVRVKWCGAASAVTRGRRPSRREPVRRCQRWTGGANGRERPA